MKKPNILIFMCDQFQGRVLTQNKQVITPTLDKIMQEGVIFNNAYTPNPVCSPARASLMTGLLPHNHGVIYVNHCVDKDQSNLRTEHPHFAQKLSDGGYYTGYVGRWHVDRTHCPKDFGWSVDFSIEGGLFEEKAKELIGIDYPLEEKFISNRKVQKPFGYSQNVLYGVVEEDMGTRCCGVSTTIALDFLKSAKEKEQPWCCYVGFNEPHDPYICSKQAYEMYDVDKIELPKSNLDTMMDKPGLYRKVAKAFDDLTERERKEAMACYFGSVTEIDTQLCRIVDFLKETEQYDDTIIIFTSDHGDFLGAHGLYCKNVSAFEEAYNIPLIMCGPSIPKGAKYYARVGLQDLCPTLLDLASCEVIQNTDSCSFKPIFDDSEKQQDYMEGYAEYHGTRIMLTQRVLWDRNIKYVLNGFDEDELYDLEKDPYELYNLINNPIYKEILRKMCKKMWSYIKKTNDHSLYNSSYPIIRIAPYGPMDE